jgi:hypothetical protein
MVCRRGGEASHAGAWAAAVAVGIAATVVVVGIMAAAVAVVIVAAAVAVGIVGAPVAVVIVATAVAVGIDIVAVGIDVVAVAIVDHADNVPRSWAGTETGATATQVQECAGVSA